MPSKTTHLQIRMTPEQKSRLKLMAKRAGLDMSEWVLSKVFPSEKETWNFLLKELARTKEPRFVLAEINDFLTELTKDRFLEAISDQVFSLLGIYLSNYVAAMVESAAHQKDVIPPSWVLEVAPLERPVFGTDLESLRLYLLTHAPLAFRKRNIFIDSTLGDRV